MLSFDRFARVHYHSLHKFHDPSANGAAVLPCRWRQCLWLTGACRAALPPAADYQPAAAQTGSDKKKRESAGGYDPIARRYDAYHRPMVKSGNESITRGK